MNKGQVLFKNHSVASVPSVVKALPTCLITSRSVR
jgi:hypothetical protein